MALSERKYVIVHDNPYEIIFEMRWKYVGKTS